MCVRRHYINKLDNISFCEWNAKWSQHIKRSASYRMPITVHHSQSRRLFAVANKEWFSLGKWWCAFLWLFVCLWVFSQWVFFYDKYCRNTNSVASASSDLPQKLLPQRKQWVFSRRKRVYLQSTARAVHHNRGPRFCLLSESVAPLCGSGRVTNGLRIKRSKWH